jgi:hypothetical protein
MAHIQIMKLHAGRTAFVFASVIIYYNARQLIAGIGIGEFSKGIG